MVKKATRKLTIVPLVLTLAVVIVHTPVIGYAQAQSVTKVLRIGYFPNINLFSSCNRFWEWRIPEGTWKQYTNSAIYIQCGLISNSIASGK